MFPPIGYLEWLEGRPEAAPFDLASSALRFDDGDAVVPPVLADREGPPAGVTLHTQLATAYGVHPERVVVTAGATHANFLAMAVALSEGDAARALVEKPAYEPFRRTPVGFGSEVDRFLREADADYALDPERAANACRDDTGLVVVTNRHNPSGRLEGRDSLAALAEVARDVDARLLVDEVYAPYVADGSSEDGDGAAFGGPTAAGLEGTVVTGSMSKAFGLPDVRVGWLIADREFAAAARGVKRHVPAVADTSVALAERALYHSGDVLGRARDRLAENAALLDDFVAGRDDLSGPLAPGSPFGFLATDAESDGVVEVAWETGVLVAPGRFFDDDGRVRVALGGSPEDCEAGLRAFAGVLDRLRG